MTILAHKGMLNVDRIPIVGRTGTGTVTHVVSFRSLFLPNVQVPTVTPSREVLKAQALRVITISTPAQWDAAVSDSRPGDFLDIIAPLIRTNGFDFRGSKWNIPGGNGASSGTEANPVVISCDTNGWFDGNGLSNVQPSLDVNNVDYVWCVEVKTRNSTFGVRYMNVEGSATAPCRHARCFHKDTGYSGISFGGWWQELDAYAPGNTRPAGEEFSWGYSRHFVIEGNYFSNHGIVTDHYGEGIYFGRGAAPGWIGWASDCWVRYNVIELCTADGIEFKPGCERMYCYGNIIRKSGAHFGAPINALFASSGIVDRPSWRSGDPEIYIESNRVYDINITKTTVSSDPWLYKIGMAGVRMAFNLGWSWRRRDGTYSAADTGYAAVGITTQKPLSQFGAHPTWVVNNTFAGGGVYNLGYDDGGGYDPVTAANGAVDITLLNNLVPVGYTGGTHTYAVDGSDFVAPIPAVGQLSSAEWLGYGEGSAFDLASGTSLDDAGSDVSAYVRHLTGDISQRSVSSTPEPGCFQLVG